MKLSQNIGTYTTSHFTICLKFLSQPFRQGMTWFFFWSRAYWWEVPLWHSASRRAHWAYWPQLYIWHLGMDAWRQNLAGSVDQSVCTWLPQRWLLRAVRHLTWRPRALLEGVPLNRTQIAWSVSHLKNLETHRVASAMLYQSKPSYFLWFKMRFPHCNAAM